METTYINPMPFNEALAHLSEKQAVGTPMNTAAWQELPVAIRQRAFFSATLTSAKLAQEMQDYIADFLSEKRENGENGESFLTAQGRDEFVAKFSELLHKEGFGRIAPDGSIDPHINHNSLRDLRSARRLQLIFDTQTTAAYSYARYLEGQDEDILDVFPCSRFIRVHPVTTPRPYHQAALGQIRRKDDLKFWLSLNRDFGVPWAPWGFNSGCDVEDVDRDEAIEAGIIKETETVKPVIEDFNKELEASVANLGPDIKNWIKTQLDGKLCRFVDGKVTYLPYPYIPPFVPRKRPINLSPDFEHLPPIDEPRTIPKTASYIEKQKARIAQTVKKRQDKLNEEMEAFEQTQWIIYRLDSKKYNLSYEDFLNQLEYDKNFYRDKIYKHSLYFLRSEGIYIPPSDRKDILPLMVHLDDNGNPTDDNPLRKQITPNVRNGIELITSIVNPEKIPSKVGWHISKDITDRAYAKGYNILVLESEAASIVAHELAHIIENHNYQLRENNISFLYHRTRGESPVQLSSIFSNSNYKDSEFTLKDHWVEKGGSAYCGKINIKPEDYNVNFTEKEFSNCIYGTEFFSMGIERLLENPIDFKKKDPEYYSFIINQIK